MFEFLGEENLPSRRRALLFAKRQLESQMEFQEAVRVCFAKYFDFQGEASRPEFWWFFLFVGVVSFALAVVSSKLSGLFSLAVLIPYLAVTVRRLHDTNRSAWWVLVWFVPVVGWLILVFLLVQQGDRR